MTLLVRRLIASVLYLCSATFFITHAALGGAASFTIDLIGGVIAWVLAGIQSVYLRSVAIHTLHDIKKAPLIKSSSHSAINAALYATSAVFFIAGDAYVDTTPLNIRATRLAGSTLWLLSALTYGWLAWHERKQENHPDKVIKPMGKDPRYFHFICESEYLAAGILYAAAIYMSDPIPGLKAAGNACWLLASTHEAIRTYRALPVPDQEEAVEAELAAPSP